MFLVLFFLLNMIYILVKIVHPKKETKVFFFESLRLTTGREEFRSYFVVRTPLYFDCLDLFIFLCLPQTG